MYAEIITENKYKEFMENTCRGEKQVGLSTPKRNAIIEYASFYESDHLGLLTEKEAKGVSIFHKFKIKHKSNYKQIF